MQKSSSNIRNLKRWHVLYLFLLIVPILLSVGNHRSHAGSEFPQEEIVPETLGFTENFDGLAAPNLPVGWSTIGVGLVLPFVTSTNTPDTAPNTLFVNDPGTAGQSEITTPPVQIGSFGSKLIFRNNYLTEGTFDGGVLEIKIGAGAFQDIVTAGGNFVSGGYNSIVSGIQNPLPIPPATSRPAWSGNSQGFVTTEVNLPPSTQGQIIQFKWRMGTDSSVGGTGWRIDTVTVTNTITSQNLNSIAIPDSGPASLYPSSLSVSGLIGAVSSVGVALNGFSHTAPDDVDILLVAPGGRKVVLMSDVGGAIPVNNLNLAFIDSVPGSLPDNGPLVSGNFKPTNVGDDESFPAPAPGGPPTGNTFAAFNGINPNGTWSLYLVDDNGNSAGNIAGGWEILIGTNASACSLGLSSTVQVFPITGGSGNFDIDSPFGCDWTATSIHNWITITSPTSGAGGLSTLTFDVAPNMLGGRSGIIRVSSATQSRDFNVQQPSGCPFSLSETTQQFAAAGGQGNVGVIAASACGWTATTSNNWITINSGTGAGDGTVTYTVSPNPLTVPRAGSVNVGPRTLTVNQAASNNRTTLFDFDADDKADMAVFRTTTNVWYVYNSADGTVSAQQFGLTGDKLPTADYDGDGRSDIAVFRQGTWYILESLTSVMRTVQWGVESDLVAPADYDGDGKADIAVWRESSGTWYVQKSSNGLNHVEHFGSTGDYPVSRDYDGDGKADLAVFRPGSSTWFIQRTSDGTLRTEIFGQLGDRLVPADYDGDGMTDIAVWRGNTSTWYLLQSTFGFVGIGFGESTDQLVPADYDGDGKADIAVMRNGNWFIYQSSNGVVRIEQFGTSTDVALQSALIAP